MYHLLLAALTAAPSAAGPQRLKTIATVNASLTCSNMARAANAAITAANENDAVIAQMVALLQPSSLQNLSAIQRKQIVNQLTAGGTGLTQTAQIGKTAVLSFFMAAPTTLNSAQQQSVAGFAKALNTALHRQDIFGQGLDGFARMLAGRDASGMANATTKAESLSENVSTQGDPNNPYNTSSASGSGGLYRQTSIQQDGPSQGVVAVPQAGRANDAQIAAAAQTRLAPFVQAIAKDEASAMSALGETIPGCGS